MKDETKKAIKNFTLEVLDFFLGIPESFAIAFDRKEFHRQINGFATEKQLTCDNIAKFIFNLKKSGYIEIKKTSQGESIQFTNKARLSIIDRIVDRTVDDHKYRFVSFDIPERLRINRDKFRRALKRMGFIQIQKSLWVCNKNVGQFVELAAYEYGVEKYIVYIVSEKTDIDGIIQKKFQ